MKAIYIKRKNIVVEFKQVGQMREATILRNTGCTYHELILHFHSAEEGNELYKSYINDGFVKATSDDFDKIVRGY